MKRCALLALMAFYALSFLSADGPDRGTSDFHSDWTELASSQKYGELLARTTETLNTGQNAHAYFYRGIAWFNLGEYENAKNDFEMAAPVYGHLGTYQHWLAETYFELGQYEQALQAGKKALPGSDEPALVHLLIARCLEILGQYESAIESVNEARRLRQVPVVLYARARLYLKARGFIPFLATLHDLFDVRLLAVPLLMWLAGFLLVMGILAWAAAKGRDDMQKYQLFTRISRLFYLPSLLLFIYLLQELSVISAYVNLAFVFIPLDSLLIYLVMALIISLQYYFFILFSRTLPGYIAVRRWRNPELRLRRQLKLSSTFFIYILMIQIAVFAHNLLIDFIDTTGPLSLVASVLLAAVLVLAILVFYPRVLALFYGRNRELGKNVNADFRELLEECGLPVRKINVIKTSDIKMANAWVSGLGVYSLVVTDYLIANFSRDEIKNVICHEIGHIRKKHLLFNYLFILGWLFTGALVRKYVSGSLSVYFIWTMAYFAIVFMAFSRRFEYQADRFAVTLTGQPEVYINMLLKLGKKNWMPVRFRKIEEKASTHPSIEKRIARIRQDFMPGQPASEGI